jgi:hypothetical protein
MKKEYAVGNWFPSEIKQTNVDNSIDRTEEVLRTGEGDAGFKVKYLGDNKYRVAASAVNSIFVDFKTFTIAPSSQSTNIWIKITFNKDGVATAASLTTTDPGDDTETKGSRLIATVSDEGVGQIITGTLNAVSAGVRKQISTI